MSVPGPSEAPTAKSGFLNNVRMGVIVGSTIAVGFSFIAIVVNVGGDPELKADHISLLGLIATYWAGGLCVGAIGGALRPLARTTSGFALVTGLLGALAYVPFDILINGSSAWRQFDWGLAAVFGALGVGVGLGARARIRARALERQNRARE
jgi:hypothetical protein